VSRPLTLAVALAASLVTMGSAAAARAADAPPAVAEDTVHQVAAALRCVVCQNLSVADSPSEMARQMRDLIRERLAAGETPEQIRAYFVARYGEWVLLAPPARGFNLVLWLAPFAALAAGFGVVVSLARRSGRRPAGPEPAPPVDARDRQRIEAELGRLRE
jgi:cytochrome c-type biogenesis protein CcmH